MKKISKSALSILLAAIMFFTLSVQAVIVNVDSTVYEGGYSREVVDRVYLNGEKTDIKHWENGYKIQYAPLMRAIGYEPKCQTNNFCR